LRPFRTALALYPHRPDTGNSAPQMPPKIKPGRAISDPGFDDTWPRENSPELIAHCRSNSGFCWAIRCRDSEHCFAMELRFQTAMHTDLAIRTMAARLRSTSSSVVAQLETLMRIAV
jgi:hypothetical protein